MAKNYSNTNNSNKNANNSSSYGNTQSKNKNSNKNSKAILIPMLPTAKTADGTQMPMTSQTAIRSDG